jgi:hypothetical protein
MDRQPFSATDPGATLVAALAERDFDRLAGALTPGVRMRALIPSGAVEVSGRETAAAKFASWFGQREAVELVALTCGAVGDRLHLGYRLRVRDAGASWKILEQHLFCTVESGRISALDLVCCGLRPEQVVSTALQSGVQRNEVC